MYKHYLPLKYWQLRAIFSIARGVCTPISLDDCTMNTIKEFFAHVVFDLDMLPELPNQILLERLGFSFVVDIKYEILPPLYCSCKMIGHTKNNCRRYKVDEKKNCWS